MDLELVGLSCTAERLQGYHHIKKVPLVQHVPRNIKCVEEICVVSTVEFFFLVVLTWQKSAATDIQNKKQEKQREEPIPHFVAVFPDEDTMLCYEIQAAEDIAYNLISNEYVEMAGYFMYYPKSAHIVLDMVSISLNWKDSKLPDHIVFSGSKKEVRVGDVVLPVGDPQCITIMETQVIIIPSKMDHHSEVTVKLEKLELEFSILFANSSQLQLVIVHMSNGMDNEGLIGK